jgi:hypothetical protein
MRLCRSSRSGRQTTNGHIRDGTDVWSPLIGNELSAALVVDAPTKVMAVDLKNSLIAASKEQADRMTPPAFGLADLAAQLDATDFFVLAALLKNGSLIP